MCISDLSPRLRGALASEKITLKAASVVALITAALYFLTGPDSWSVLLGTAVCLSLFALASFHWIDGKFKALRATGIHSWATRLFHIFVVFLAAIPARFAVAHATGLPPQDFDLSVALLTGLLYVPVWFGVTSAVLLLIATVQFSYSLLLLFVTMPIQQFVIALISEQSAIREWTVKRSEESQRFIKLTFGTIILSALLAGMFGMLTSLVITQSTFVRWIAYCADFQSIPSYPCLTTGERARLHENGAVSIAKPSRMDVDIRVEVLNFEKACLSEHR
jgi:hypothetical protein